MKKLLVLAVAVGLASFVVVSDLRAEEGSELEISGNITTVSGWSHSRGGATRQSPLNGGITGDGLAPMGGTSNTLFGFVIDQVELDLAKSFGENIRIRADLDFTPVFPGKGAIANGTAGSGTGNGDVMVEQAYTTANIPAGNGIELLVGRFNSGFGLDPIDRNELKTISHNMVHRTLLPHNLTGARAAYDFTDQWRWEVFVVNNLGDTLGADSDLPSLGSNVSYTWGDEGNKSWAKLSAAAGPERATKKHWSFLADLAASFAATEALTIAAEGAYRQDDNLGGVAGNAQFLGGTLQGTYAFSDVWDGTLRYSYVWDYDSGQVGSALGSGIVTNDTVGVPGLAYPGQNHELSLASGYQITEGARFGLEGRVDLANSSTAGVGTGMGFGFGGMFAYSF